MRFRARSLRRPETVAGVPMDSEDEGRGELRLRDQLLQESWVARL